MTILSARLRGRRGPCLRRHPSSEAPDILSMREALGYVLSLPVSTAIVGFDSPAQVDEAVVVARQFQPLAPYAMARLEALVRTSAEQLTWFKRAGFPTPAQID